MRVLVVAPEIDKEIVSPWIGAAQGHELTVLNGTVTVREVLSCIATGRYQIVQFMAHGDCAAMEMSDGTIPDQLLENALRAASAQIELVILHACHSVGLGAHLYTAGVPRVLSWRVAVPIATAIDWSQTFYRALAIDHDIWSAQYTASEMVRNNGGEPPIYLNGRLVKLESEVNALRKRTQASGLPRWAFGLLVAYGVLLAAILAMMVAR